MKKIIPIMIAAILTVLPCYAVLGEDTDDAAIEKIEFKQGIVKEVIPFYDTGNNPVDSSFFIWLQLSDNAEDVVVFQVNEQTKMVNNFKISEGAQVRASYNANLPVILIYPPRYSAVSVEVLNEGLESSRDSMNNSKITIIVDEERIMGAFAYEEDGILMVPVRAVFEQLMYPVEWDAELKQIRIGNGISMTIGKDEYNYARMAPFKLGAAPTIKDGITYVPLSFFSDVMRFASGRMPDGNITIVSTANR